MKPIKVKRVSALELGHTELAQVIGGSGATANEGPPPPAGPQKPTKPSTAP